jgi:hypothetical protein
MVSAYTLTICRYGATMACDGVTICCDLDSMVWISATIGRRSLHGGSRADQGDRDPHDSDAGEEGEQHGFRPAWNGRFWRMRLPVRGQQMPIKGRGWELSDAGVLTAVLKTMGKTSDPEIMTPK